MTLRYCKLCETEHDDETTQMIVVPAGYVCKPCLDELER